ncbi:aminotransferase class V-fold PLP-dependent enzyme [Clostridiales bacterium]|nr:aminotransferase class V-fold PLP-dependent enzyme [Clostridiales bacterium]
MTTRTTPLYDFLHQHAAKKTASFHMPGHKGAQLYQRLGYGDFMRDFFNYDVTEIPGADNLFQTEGVLEDIQKHYKELYQVENSYLLINGTSGGIIASILASVKKGGKLVMARNCHKSAFNALILGDVRPVYAYPEENQEYGISGPIPAAEIARLLDENQDAEAVILPSPNYYGICSDIRAIAAEVHKQGRILIVDQAHGAHLKFFNAHGFDDMPLCAEEAGADLVINSTHKTLASLTQSAVLNRATPRVDQLLLEDKLQAIQSTSPSYILMTSLDVNAAILKEHGKELITEWGENLNYFYQKAAKIKGLNVMGKFPGLDWSKLNFSLGIPGGELEQWLMKEHGVFIELFTGDLVMCMTGIGNTRKHMDRLLVGLTEISEKPEVQENLRRRPEKSVWPAGTKGQNRDAELYPIPKERHLVSLEEAEEKICASSVIPYPPGIPFLCPGEKFHKEQIEYIKDLRAMGEKVIGVTAEGGVFVGK